MKHSWMVVSPVSEDDHAVASPYDGPSAEHFVALVVHSQMTDHSCPAYDGCPFVEHYSAVYSQHSSRRNYPILFPMAV